MRSSWLATTLVVVGATALLVAGAAGGAATHGGPKSSATPVFKLRLKPSQEVPRIRDLRANAVGHVTFDLERSGGAITSGEVIFYFNYWFAGGAVTITGLHVHQGAKGTNGPVLISSGVAPFTDGDGQGNITTVVTGTSPTVLQAILDKPRDYYVNLHTSVNPDGALRDQMHNPKKR